MPAKKMFISPATMPETSVGRNKVRGTGSISGRWTIDPRDGFARTATSSCAATPCAATPAIVLSARTPPTSSAGRRTSRSGELAAGSLTGSAGPVSPPSVSASSMCCRSRCRREHIVQPWPHDGILNVAKDRRELRVVLRGHQFDVVAECVRPRCRFAHSVKNLDRRGEHKPVQPKRDHQSPPPSTSGASMETSLRAHESIYASARGAMSSCSGAPHLSALQSSPAPRRRHAGDLRTGASTPAGHPA